MPALALRSTCALLLFFGLATAPALAQTNPVPGAPSLPLSPAALANGVASRITYQHGIEFVTIGGTYGGAGNAPFTTANPNDFVNGRGGVNYEYRIGRYEVTTSQWVEFFNAALAAATTPPLARSPHFGYASTLAGVRAAPAPAWITAGTTKAVNGVWRVFSASRAPCRETPRDAFRD